MYILSPRRQIYFPPFRLDLSAGRLFCGEEPRDLPPKPFQVLQYLAEHPGRLLSKEELLEEIWPDVFVGDEVLKAAVSVVRKVLDDSFRKPRFIETAHRRGYRFVASIEAPPSSVPPLFVMRWEEVRTRRHPLSPRRGARKAS